MAKQMEKFTEEPYLVFAQHAEQDGNNHVQMKK
jgi:hypothetical protein